MAAPAIGLRPRWAPGPGVQVDRSHPMSQGLVAWITGDGGLVERVSRRPLTRVGAPALTASMYGASQGLTGVGDNGGYLDISAAGDELQLQPPLSLAFVGAQVATPDNSSALWGAIHNNADSNPYNSWSLGVNYDQAYALYGNNGGSFSSLTGATSAATHRGPLVLAATITPSVRNLWVNGVRESTASGWSSIAYGGTARLILGCYLGSSRATGAVAAAAYAWRRELTPAEVAALSADPFCFLTR